MEVPNNEELRKYYGYATNSNSHKEVTRALSSTIYDVENKINENILAGKLKNSLIEMLLENDDDKKEMLYSKFIEGLKSNEITAIPEFLDMLFIKGAIVTIDAMSCHKDIATKIVKEKKADYVLSLKDNHEILKGEVEEYYKDEEQSDFKDDKILQYSTMEKGHGIIEERMYRLGSVKSAEEYAKGVRMHWGIESSPWSLDVTFHEYASRTRKGCAPQNLALLKRLVLNMVKKDQERYPKRSLKSRRFLASLREDYLEYIF